MVAIVQDRVPDYRIPFFEKLHKMGVRDGIRYIVFSSSKVMSRNHDGFDHQSIRAIRLGRKRSFFLHYDFRVFKECQVLVLEMALHNPTALIFALRNRRLKRKILVFWGHGGYWTKKVTYFQKKVLWSLVKKADHSMIYTSEGAIRAIESGIFLEDISILRNSVDTRSIIESKKNLSSAEHTAWLKRYGLGTLNFGCAIANFGIEKQLRFLFDALIQIRSQIANFEFIFFGEGPGLDAILSQCEKYPWIKFGGVANQETKAQIALTKAVILNPGRVGLIAVDSIAMGVPIVSRKLEFVHAPEFDYLSHPQTVIVSDDSVSDFTNCAVNLILNSELRDEMSQALVALQPRFSTEIMAINFHNGILGIL
jgi:glycosyltransferase involved in cell wall biosynthesis